MAEYHSDKTTWDCAVHSTRAINFHCFIFILILM